MGLDNADADSDADSDAVSDPDSDADSNADSEADFDADAKQKIIVGRYLYTAHLAWYISSASSSS